MAKRVSFEFRPGRKVGARYVIEGLLGAGSEGEVYRIRELDTDIHRAAKFYFPHIDPTRRKFVRHAQRLNSLRNCPIVLQYHHSEVIKVRKEQVVALISDLCDGIPLEQWLRMHPGHTATPYQSLHILYALTRGLEAIHLLGHYHADVHSQNILIQPRGVRFELKLIDFFDWGKPARYKQQQDVRDAIAVFFECLGGVKCYAGLPPELKHIIAGRRHDLIRKRFPTTTALRQHLETFPWTDRL